MEMKRVRVSSHHTDLDNFFLHELLLIFVTAEERQRLTDAVKHHQVNSTSIPNRPEGELATYDVLSNCPTQRS